MEVISTGITAHLTEEDIIAAVIAHMDNEGYPVESHEIEFTMGRNPKALKAKIVTGIPAPTEPVTGTQTTAATSTVDVAKTEDTDQVETTPVADTEEDDPMMAAASDDVDTSGDTAPETTEEETPAPKKSLFSQP